MGEGHTKYARGGRIRGDGEIVDQMRGRVEHSEKSCCVVSTEERQSAHSVGVATERQRKESPNSPCPKSL